MKLSPQAQSKLQEIVEKPSVFVEEVLGIEPWDYQKEFLDNPSKRKVFVGGRQVGKTVSMGWLGLHRFATRKNHSVLFVAPSKRQAVNLFDRKLKAEIPDWIDNPEDFGITYETKTEMRSVTGSTMKAVTATDQNRGETIRGFTIDTIIADEAAFIQDNIFTSILMPMLLNTDGELIIASTPFGEEGFFYDKWMESQEKDGRWFGLRVPTIRNPNIESEDIDEFRDDLTSPEFKREILAEFDDPEDSFFDKKDIKECIYRGSEDHDEAYPNSTTNEVYLGVDLATSGESRASFVSIDADGNVFHVENVASCTIPQLERKVKRLHADHRYREILIDQTGLGEGPVNHLQREMSNVAGMKFTLQSKQSVYNTLRREIEDHHILLPDDRELISELSSIRYESTPRGHTKIFSNAKHDDFADALALAVYSMTGWQTTERLTRAVNMGESQGKRRDDGRKQTNKTSSRIHTISGSNRNRFNNPRSARGSRRWR